MFSKFLSKVKSFLSNTIKYVVGPSFIGGGKIASGTGNALFIFPKFINYITGSQASPTIPTDETKTYPATRSLSWGAAGFGMIATFLTQTFSTFLYPHVRQQEKVNPIKPKLGKSGQALVFVTKFSGGISSIFITISNYLNAKTLLSLLFRNKYIIEIGALYFALSNVLSFFRFNRPMAANYAELFGEKIENGELKKLDRKYVLTTLFIASLAFPSVGTTAFFSTYNGVGLLFWIGSRMPSWLCTAVASFSAVNATYFHTLSTSAPLYNLVSSFNQPRASFSSSFPNEQNSIPIPQQANLCEKSINALAIFVLGMNAILAGISNFTAFVITLEELSKKIGIHNILLKIVAGTCSTTFALLTGLFTYNGWQKNLSNLKKVRQQRHDLEQPEESTPILSQSNHPSIYSSLLTGPINVNTQDLEKGYTVSTTVENVPFSQSIYSSPKNSFFIFGLPEGMEENTPTSIVIPKRTSEESNHSRKNTQDEAIGLLFAISP